MPKVRRICKSSCCFVPDCKSGYSSCREKYSLFSIPKDQNMIEIWQKNIQRIDRILDRTCAVCERHFEDKFIVRYYKHILSGDEVLIPRQRPVLTADAIPTIFPNSCNSIKKFLPKTQPEILITCENLTIKEDEISKMTVSNFSNGVTKMSLESKQNSLISGDKPVLKDVSPTNLVQNLPNNITPLLPKQKQLIPKKKPILKEDASPTKIIPNLSNGINTVFPKQKQKMLIPSMKSILKEDQRPTNIIPNLPNGIIKILSKQKQKKMISSKKPILKNDISPTNIISKLPNGINKIPAKKNQKILIPRKKQILKEDASPTNIFLNLENGITKLLPKQKTLIPNEKSFLKKDGFPTNSFLHLPKDMPQIVSTSKQKVITCNKPIMKTKILASANSANKILLKAEQEDLIPYEKQIVKEDEILNLPNDITKMFPIPDEELNEKDGIPTNFFNKTLAELKSVLIPCKETILKEDIPTNIITNSPNEMTKIAIKSKHKGLITCEKPTMKNGIPIIFLNLPNSTCKTISKPKQEIVILNQKPILKEDGTSSCTIKNFHNDITKIFPEPKQTDLIPCENLSLKNEIASSIFPKSKQEDLNTGPKPIVKEDGISCSAIPNFPNDVAKILSKSKEELLIKYEKPMLKDGTPSKFPDLTNGMTITIAKPNQNALIQHQTPILANGIPASIIQNLQNCMNKILPMLNQDNLIQCHKPMFKANGISTSISSNVSINKIIPNPNVLIPDKKSILKEEVPISLSPNNSMNKTFHKLEISIPNEKPVLKAKKSIPTLLKQMTKQKILKKKNFTAKQFELTEKKRRPNSPVDDRTTADFNDSLSARNLFLNISLPSEYWAKQLVKNKNDINTILFSTCRIQSDENVAEYAYEKQVIVKPSDNYSVSPSFTGTVYFRGIKIDQISCITTIERILEILNQIELDSLCVGAGMVDEYPDDKIKISDITKTYGNAVYSESCSIKAINKQSVCLPCKQLRRRLQNRRSSNKRKSKKMKKMPCLQKKLKIKVKQVQNLKNRLKNIEEKLERLKRVYKMKTLISLSYNNQYSEIEGHDDMELQS